MSHVVPSHILAGYGVSPWGAVFPYEKDGGAEVLYLNCGLL